MLNLKLPSQLPAIKGDEQRIIQVLTNLVDNAIKFTEKGSIIISAKRSNSGVLVQVEDTGIGIDKRHISKLFDKYYQVTSAEHIQKGTGLGLAICKEIIKKHNGRIWAESRGIGNGSTFCFTLPI